MSASPENAWQSSPPLAITLTPVIGREADLDGVLTLIDDPTHRLITLTGPGGVGKTRLALLVGETLVNEFGRSLTYVSLASIRDAELVLPTIGQALDSTFDAGEGYQHRLAETLRNQPGLLLVLDNFEQLLDAAPRIADLLAQCPDVTILVTSQAALGIPGEHLYPLAPLPTPSTDLTTAEAILRSDAVALFVARARAVKPGLAVDDRLAVTIAEICRRLDGLPLAIELAAARMNILSPEALLARLSNRLQVLGGERRGVPDRLRTMRHAVAWSYDLLPPAEQRLFRQMSVFAGGVPLDAVETLHEATGDGRDSWSEISALVDHSLVQPMPEPDGDARFLMLETLRDYGHEQLDANGESGATRRAHAEWILALAGAAEPRLQGADQERWLNRLELEWENIRAAMAWSLDNGREDLVFGTLSAIQRFITARGRITETREFLERALAATGDEHSLARCRGLIAAGNLAEDQGNMDLAQTYCIQARALAVSLGDLRCEALALIGQGYVAHDRGDYATAIAVHAQAESLARTLGDQHILGTALGNLAAVSYFQGNLGDAQRYWEEAGHIFAVRGDHLTEALVVGNLGAIAAEQGEYERAERLQRRALALQRQLGNVPNIALALINLAAVSCQLGDYTLAKDQLAEAIPMLRELGYKAAEGIGLHTLATVAFAEADLQRAAAVVLESIRLLAEADDQLNICGNVDLLAKSCARRNEYETAIELMSAAAGLRQRLGSTPNPVNAAEIEALDRTLRAAVSDAAYQRQVRAGSGLDRDALVRRASIVAREIAGPTQPQVAFPVPEVIEPRHSLTNRELEVLRLLTEGRSTREISDTLYISPRTTTTHVNNIFGKLEVNSRAAAVAHAMRSGLV